MNGSCLCKTVTWRIDGPFDRMTHCHCSMCRKAHAAAFGTYVGAPKAGFEWLSGESAISRYESSPGFVRAFCSSCGSLVPEGYRPERISMPAACLDGDPGIRPSAHIFATSKAPWHEIADELPHFDAYPSPGDGPNVERPTLGPATPGVLRGSCLCGDVAYEVREPFKRVDNCHCSRCRKARAAAHATNGFTAMDAVIFVRGEDKLVTYRLPEARYFSQVFCRTCGSGMPRLDPERGIAVVPFGSLDDDPARRADDHIYVASKAPWYEIADDLPCFDEAPG